MNFEEWYATQDKNVFRSGEEHMRLAYSAGAEQMREKAVMEAIKFFDGPEFGFDGKNYWKVQEKIRDAIRALPIGAPQEKP